MNKADSLVKTYIFLTKPGIIIGNFISAAAGFFLASRGYIDYVTCFASLSGISLVIASACVLNNYIDRDIDRIMARTRNRAIAAHLISGRNAGFYAVILGILGFLLLFAYTNLLTVILAFIGFFVYVVLYGIWKRHSPFGTIVGSISGAIPPVVGYCAVTNQFDTGAVLLFLFLVIWQMPHFYAIAIYRLDDYKAAKIPVLPAAEGIHTTKIHMVFYIVAFAIVSGLLTAFGYTGNVYLAVSTLLSLLWLIKNINGFYIGDTIKWSRDIYKFSLRVLAILSLLMAFEALLP